MKSSEILRKAKARLESGEGKYICLSVVIITRIEREPKKGNKILAEIKKALGKNATYESWFYRHYPHVYSIMTSADFRAGRIQWVADMIRRYESIGD